MSAKGIVAGMVLTGGILLMTTIIQAQERTYAERLGWPQGTRAVIFHVDDVGMSHDSNLGAIRAWEEGVASSMSVMMPCSWVPEFAAYVKNHPEVDVGVHLTLTAEWKNYRWGPVAGKPSVPGLVDAQGCLWPGVLEVAAHANAQEVETEMRAQINKALSMGITPTHLDAHMGTCFHPLYLERYIKLGIEKNIPILLFGGHMQHIGREVGTRKDQLLKLAQQVWVAGLPVIDDLVTKPTRGKDYAQRKAELMQLLRTLKPGVTEIIVHCTAPTEVFSAISGSGPAREAEMNLMIDRDIKTLIADEGIVITTWRELKKRRAAL
jgi:chitin disaccharide deacetylase